MLHLRYPECEAGAIRGTAKEGLIGRRDDACEVFGALVKGVAQHVRRHAVIELAAPISQAARVNRPAEHVEEYIEDETLVGGPFVVQHAEHRSRRRTEHRAAPGGRE